MLGCGFDPVKTEALMFRALLTLICAALLVAGAWWWFHEPPAGVVPTQAAAAPGASAKAPQPAHPAAAVVEHRAPEPAGPEPGTAKGPDYRAQFRAADDYWDLAQALYVPARQGDPSAQYWLSRALAYCESLYDWYFIVHLPNGGVRHRTLDEAQQLTASRPVFTPDDVHDIQKRCQQLRSADYPPFGTSREWLEAATTANYPMAQVSAALNRALQVRQTDTDGARAARDDARRLAFDSLRSRDPDVMAQLGDVAANLAGDDPAEARKQQWLWPLAACLREAKCDSMSEWMRLFCNIDTQCQPFETPVDVIRRQAGNDFDEIERRARELNEKLDAGTLEESDIGGRG